MTASLPVESPRSLSYWWFAAIVVGYLAVIKGLGYVGGLVWETRRRSVLHEGRDGAAVVPRWAPHWCSPTPWSRSCAGGTRCCGSVTQCSAGSGLCRSSSRSASASRSTTPSFRQRPRLPPRASGRDPVRRLGRGRHVPRHRCHHTALPRPDRRQGRALVERHLRCRAYQQRSHRGRQQGTAPAIAVSFAGYFFYLIRRVSRGTSSLRHPRNVRLLHHLGHHDRRRPGRLRRIRPPRSWRTSLRGAPSVIRRHNIEPRPPHLQPDAGHRDRRASARPPRYAVRAGWAGREPHAWFSGPGSPNEPPDPRALSSVGRASDF